MDSLRELAERKTTKISYFIGLSGIHLANSIKTNNVLIYPLDSIDNPELHTSRIDFRSTSSDCNILFGAMACIKIPIRVVGPGKEKVSVMTETKELSIFMNKINLSLFFLKNITIGIDFTFAESGFTLNHRASHYQPQAYFHPTMLKNKDLELFTYWLKKIDTHYKDLEITFNRLVSAITKNKYSADAIIDGVIAWESLFGGPGETKLKVCGSILKLLDPEDKPKFYKKLIEVYNIRSKIVHGGKSKLSNMRETKNFICDVTRDCLIKLIDDRPDLISLTAVERCKKILLGI